MKRVLKVFILAGMSLLSRQALAQSYDDDFAFLQRGLEIWNFSDAQLDTYENPFVGVTQFRLSEANAPWAGNYFAMKNGGVANRWQLAAKAYPRIEDLPDREEVRQMSSEDLNQLSPAEKYDIYMGDYDYTFTKMELQQRGPFRIPKPSHWEGFCNGVRCASTILPEPVNSIKVKNADGIRIKFQPTDLKALAGVSYFFVEKYAQMGSPSLQGRAESQPNPAAFDLALRYFLAKKNKAFMVDSNLGPEIWNESVIGFQRNLSAPMKLRPAEKSERPWAVSKILVSGYIETLGEVKIAETNGPTKQRVAAGNLHKKINVEYYLYLDGQGKAKDGAWLPTKGSRGVDFVWFGGGRGTDADPENWNQNGNSYLEFTKLRKLIFKSAELRCDSIFQK